MEIQGRCDARFAAVKDSFAANFAEGQELGASFAATLDGESVIDIWAGDADERGSPWRENTIVNVYSTTKTMAALSLLSLADKREVDLDAPAARYWPEFAANGKSGVLVKHFLSHSAGLSGLGRKVSIEDLYDWEKICALLAAQAPWWAPGTQRGYHALTQGYLIGELVRRVTGQSLGAFWELGPGRLPVGPVDPELAPDPEEPPRLLLGEVPRLRGLTLYIRFGDRFARLCTAWAGIAAALAGRARRP